MTNGTDAAPSAAGSTGSSSKTAPKAQAGYNTCILATEDFSQAYKAGDKVAFKGRILYCAPPGAWVDYGPSDPVEPSAPDMVS